MKRIQLAWAAVGLLLITSATTAHDDVTGARFVDADGNNASDCLDHDLPCASIAFALRQAQAGNTVKVAAGIYDMSAVPAESFLFGATKAAGGYSEADHYGVQDENANLTILVGVDPAYRLAVERQGFKWAADRAAAVAGRFETSAAPSLQATQAAAATCSQGFAAQFPCRNVDFLAQISLDQFPNAPSSAANLWGLVDLNDNREYAIIGLRNGTAIVEVTDPAHPRQVATIPGNTSAWREVKVYQVRDNAASRYRAYVYVSTEAPGSGIQVLDLSGLPNSVTLATTLTDTSSQHTLYVSNIDYGTNVALPGEEAFLYAAGSNLNSGAWRVYSLANPAQPQLITTAPAGTQYMHDSTSLYLTDGRTTQCDQGHSPCEVLVDFNENTVDLWDVTNKTQAVRLSSTTYPSATYTHSGWPSADQRSLFFHDELEEIRRGLNTAIYTMNLDDLRAPTIVTSYQTTGTTTDHNGYTKGNRYFVSHYRRGLVVFDVSNPAQLREIGAFDTFLVPAADTAGTDGAWGVYPFLPSGTVLISDISNGLFILKDNTAGLDAQAGRVGFIGSSTTVRENGGSLVVRLQRTGGYAGAVSVQYTTRDGTATAGSDYSAASGTLNWPAGDTTERSFSVAVSSDSVSETDETFSIQLSNPGGNAAIDGVDSFQVTLANDAPVTPTPPAPSGGGGGGGGLGPDLLLMLSLCWGLSRRQVRSFGRQPAQPARRAGAGCATESGRS
jgi:choice-of-anchor B domain-containing protein